MATMSSLTDRTKSSGDLVGNRLVLAGTILYLLEWVAIIGVPALWDPPFSPTDSRDQVLQGYLGDANDLGWAASWLSVVLLGRVLLLVGLRRSLSDSGRPNPLIDWAVAAMAVSVVIEVVTYGLIAGAGVHADNGGSAQSIHAVNHVAYATNGLVVGPYGLAVAVACWCMWRSGLFPAVLCAVGAVAAAAILLDVLAFGGPRFTALEDLLAGNGVLVTWVWMIWTGVLLWRRATPKHD